MSALRLPSSVLRQLGAAFAALLFAASAPLAFAGWSFDTNLTPEAARDLLAAPGFPAPPAGSWLRLRGLSSSTARDADGAEVAPWPDAKPGRIFGGAPHRTRCIARPRLPTGGDRAVANEVLDPRGCGPDQPLRRLPLDLREAADRCRRLAAAYGDLIDYWEIENEPDISFVEENPETLCRVFESVLPRFQ
ncbi:MAG: hypothetical protein WDM96_15405 [Lacunisphaera sp.]